MNKRSNLIHQAVHDLRTNVQSVSAAAEVLLEPEIGGTDRMEFALLVSQGINSTTTMLEDLLALGRLEAGFEKRMVSAFDGAALGSAQRPVAEARALFLVMEGSSALIVEGAAGKVRRILQDLVANALKIYGGGRGDDCMGNGEKNWWVKTSDTGPGLSAHSVGAA